MTTLTELNDFFMESMMSLEANDDHEELDDFQMKSMIFLINRWFLKKLMATHKNLMISYAIHCFLKKVTVSLRS